MNRKPCPFCGNTKAAIDTVNYASGEPARFRVQCPDCGSATKWHETEEPARAAWNARVPRPSQEKKTIVPENVFINKDLFFHGGILFVRNPQTGYCYGGGIDGKYKRIRKADYLLAYAECAKAAGKVKA